jgi:catechol 2,3-dioxygenase-like lactoylglutathione lyase family enzyme
VGRKRFSHITLRADRRDFATISQRVEAHGGKAAQHREGFDADGLWIVDPNGMLIQIVDRPDEPDLEAGEPFAINAPGAIVRQDRSAMKPRAATPATKPLRLGHVLVFTPDVATSIRFFEQALGMGLADRSGDIIAFMCCSRASDHHVVAFAKSPGVGFHHASFQVRNPDEVGRGGALLAAATVGGDWGFGRHTIGSNFFHYIQDPWGSWFEYYSDMDYISDHSAWTATDYHPDDSLANWGPGVPPDFVHNYEVDTPLTEQEASRARSLAAII